MTDHTDTERKRTATSLVSRRNYLRATGATIGAGALGGVASAESDSDGSGTTSERTDFLWMGAPLWDEEEVYENLLAYAKRHDLAMVFSAASTLPETATRVDEPLRKASEYGVEAWLATGCFRDDFTAPQLVDDPTARETFLDRLEQIAETYAEHFPEGKMVVWHEAPLVSYWDPNGGWTGTAVANLRDLGPDIFAWQRERIKSVSAGIDVGVFPHFPYVWSWGGNIFKQVMDGLKERDALVDFTFTDFYRGYYESQGPEVADSVVRNMMENAKLQTDGRPVYNLAEDHTLNNNYTPNKESMQSNRRTALESGADGVGWYSRTAYRKTEWGFNPFLPNVGDVDDGPREGSTYTWSRDRFQYAYYDTVASRDDFDPDDAFDLWIHGHDLDFYEHRLSLKTADGDWEYVGDFSGYVDQDYEYGTDGTDHVSIFRALDRDRYLGKNDGLDVKIETDDDSDGSELRAVYAMPFDVRNFLPEPEAPGLVERSATELARESKNLNEYSLGHATIDESVGAGDTTTATLTMGAPGRPLDALVRPHNLDEIRRLERLEASDGFHPTDYFDLWVHGSGFHPNQLTNDLYLVDEAGERRFLKDVSAAVDESDDAIAFYGIDRRYLDDLGERSVELETRGNDDRGPVNANVPDHAIDAGVRGEHEADVDFFYAMPYFGSDNFKSASDAADLMTTEMGVATYSLANEEFLDPLPDRYETYASTDARFGTSAGELVIRGNGADIWRGTDEYGAVYDPDRRVDETGTVVATVTSQANSHSWAKAGVMVRNDVTEAGVSSGYVLVAVTPRNDIAMQWDGDGDGYVDTGAGTAGETTYPCRVRLEKDGTTFTGSYSTDGETWNEIGTVDLASANEVQDAGLFMCAHASEGRAGFADFEVR